MLGKAKDQVLATKEEAWATKAWASKVVEEVVKAIKLGKEYC